MSDQVSKVAIEPSKSRLIVKAPRFQTMKCRIIGTAPYVANKFSEEARSQMRDKQAKTAWRGAAGLGWARQARRGRRGEAGKAWLGVARRGTAWRGPARRGKAKRGRPIRRWLDGQAIVLFPQEPIDETP